MLTKRKDIDMTTGPIVWQMIRFSLPLILTNLLQVLYNATDMIVVGLSSEPDAVGAIGTTGAFVALVVNLFIGLSVGANVVVAHHVGAGDDQKASRAVHTSILVGVFLGVVGGIVGVAVSRPVMSLMGNEGKVLELSVRYTQIYFAALPAHALSNYAIALHRAKGDTRTPLFVLTLTGLLNVLLNLFFVIVLGLSVEGVALATGIAALVSAIVLYANLARDSGPCRLVLRKLRLDLDEMKEILRIGLPSGLQSALFALSNMTVQSSIIRVNNAMCDPGAAYQPVVKGNAAATNLENFAYTAINSVSHATISFVSQNLGANRPERIRSIMYRAYLLNFLLGGVLGPGLFFANRPLLALYGVAPSATDALAQMAYDAALTRMAIAIAPYALLSLYEVGAGVMRGLGRSISSTIISLVGACLLRVAWIAFVFPRFGTLESIFLVYPVSWVVTALALYLASRSIVAKLYRSAQESEKIA